MNLGRKQDCASSGAAPFRRHRARESSGRGVQAENNFLYSGGTAFDDPHGRLRDAEGLLSLTASSMDFLEASTAVNMDAKSLRPRCGYFVTLVDRPVFFSPYA